MKRHLNTMFITTPGTYLSKEGETVLVRVRRETKLRIPIHALGGIVCFGRVSCSPFLMGLCAERGVAISFLSERGRFLARVHGYTAGNVLLRREQYRRADDPGTAAAIARAVVTAKIANSRTVLLRGARDHPHNKGQAGVQSAIVQLDRCIAAARAAPDLAVLRGVEGEAARTYFGVFNHLVTSQKQGFAFHARSRRPPLDNVNAALSFLYALLAHDARAACEAAGLDPAVGFVHRDRPGRPGLALDLMEEFRAYLADRLALSLINRRQVQASGFKTSPSGGVQMDDHTRKVMLVAYQKRKQEELRHPFVGDTTTVGLLLHLQATLLARHIRGDLDGYPPFVWK